MVMREFILILALAGIPGAVAQPERWSYEVAGSYPSDTGAFTQGLCYDGETLFLGTGKYGESSVRRVKLETGKTLRRTDLDRRLFGEGVAQHGRLLYQLTWQAGLAVVYDAETLQQQKSFRYRGEGWGLTSNGRELVMSNGTSVLTGRDPATFAAVWSVRVTKAGRPVSALNELEFIKGRLYANVWRSDEVMVIDPQTGVVEAVLDFSALTAATRARVREAEVLNGIAYDARRDLLLVTGKCWDRIYAVKIKGR
jgi:glutaminyl-peptide cyclotransferase